MLRRLDVIVCEILGVSREYAREIIFAGKCSTAGKILLKPGLKLAPDADIVVNAERPAYVSRGGCKLAKAVASFNLKLHEILCMDVGASTGGFTDCMLQNGAQNVLAIDNGVSQLHSSLAVNPRVISLEGIDIRNVDMSDLPYIPQFIAVDVSFISLTLIIPALAKLLARDGHMVLLVKPQFEVGRGKAGKRGVSKSADDHIAVIMRICEVLQTHELAPMALDFSPIKGQNGNIEYLLLVSFENNLLENIYITSVVKKAFAEL